MPRQCSITRGGPWPVRCSRIAAGSSGCVRRSAIVSSVGVLCGTGIVCLAHRIEDRPRLTLGDTNHDHQTRPPGDGRCGRAIADRGIHQFRPGAIRQRVHLRSHPPHQDAAHRGTAGRAAVFPEGPRQRRMERRLHRHGEGHRQGVRRAVDVCRVDLRQLGARSAVQQGRSRVRAEPHAAARTVDRLHPSDDRASVRLCRAQGRGSQYLGRPQQAGGPCRL